MPNTSAVVHGTGYTACLALLCHDKTLQDYTLSAGIYAWNVQYHVAYVTDM